MGKRAYRDALNLRLGELSHRAVMLQLRWEHAKGFERFRTLRQIESVERRKRLLQDRLRQLDRHEEGLWQDLKANVRSVTDELPSGVERWIERLDANYAEHSLEASDPLTTLPAIEWERSSR
jgi:hypothetical protein